METNCNENSSVGLSTNAPDKVINTEEEFYDDTTQADFENTENEEAYDQRFQANSRGGFR